MPFSILLLCEQEINTRYCALSQSEQQPCLKAVQGKGKLEFSLKMTDSGNPQDEGDHTLVSAWGRGRTFPFP